MMDSDPSMLEKIRNLAESVASRASELLGIELSYDRAGVEWLYRYIEDIRAGTTPEERRWVVGSLGSFLGECIIRRYGGEWAWSEEDGQWCVRFSEGNAAYPFSKVDKQFENGPEDSVLSLFDIIPEIFKGLVELDRQLIKAAEEGDLTSVRQLAEQGSDVNAAINMVEEQFKPLGFKDLRSPITSAAMHQRWEIVRFLVEHGADVNAAGEISALNLPGMSYTALSEAAREGNLEIVEFLVNRGAEIQEALYGAAAGGHVGIAKLAVNGGAKVSKKDDRGIGPLKHACYSGHLEVAKLLVQSGAHIDERDNDGNTPLMAAAKEGRFEIVKWLLNMQAQIEATDDAGQTALMKAAENGHPEIVDLLVQRGAAVKTKSGSGETALDYAENSDKPGCAAVRDLLLKHRKQGRTARLLNAMLSKVSRKNRPKA